MALASFVYRFQLSRAQSLLAVLSSVLVAACEERQSFADNATPTDDSSETSEQRLDSGLDDSAQPSRDENVDSVTDDAETDDTDQGDDAVTDESVTETDESAVDEPQIDDVLTDEAMDPSTETDESTSDEAALDEPATDESTVDDSTDDPTDDSTDDSSGLPGPTVCTLDESSFGDGCVLAP